MEIRAYQTGDEKAILELFNLAFGKQMSMNYWNWRFARNPFTKDLFIDLMWDNEKLIGHYAVSPVDMIIDEKIEKTALSMTTMTHPEYVGKGVFSKLAKSLYSKLTLQDYKMVWGFPNNNSHYGFNKNLGWKDIAIQGMMSLNSQNIIPLFKKNSECLYKRDFDDVTTNNLNRVQKKIRVNKSQQYLQWRYFDNPAADYKLLVSKDNLGVVIYKVIPSFSDHEKSEIDIMDMYFDNNKDVLLNLISTIYDTEPRVKQFNIWDSLHSENQLYLEKIGFRICPPIIYLGYSELNNTPLSIEDYKNWDISLSYSDVF
jgi:hypothetical protein